MLPMSTVDSAHTFSAIRKRRISFRIPFFGLFAHQCRFVHKMSITPILAEPNARFENAFLEITNSTNKTIRVPLKLAWDRTCFLTSKIGGNDGAATVICSRVTLPNYERFVNHVVVHSLIQFNVIIVNDICVSPTDDWPMV